MQLRHTRIRTVPSSAADGGDRNALPPQLGSRISWSRSRLLADRCQQLNAYPRRTIENRPLARSPLSSSMLPLCRGQFAGVILPREQVPVIIFVSFFVRRLSFIA